MLKYLNTFRSFLFGLLIFSYVFSVFNKPAFEILHFMCHIPSLIFSGEEIHSLDSHTTSLHSHEDLSIFYSASDDSENSPQSKTKQEVKKKIEIRENYSFNIFDGIQLAQNLFEVDLSFQIIFIKIPDPPPRIS